MYTCSVLVVPAQMCTHAVCYWSLGAHAEISVLTHQYDRMCVLGYHRSKVSFSPGGGGGGGGGGLAFGQIYKYNLIILLLHYTLNFFSMGRQVKYICLYV